MPNESPRQARARQLRQDRDRCADAARKLRYRIAQGRFSGLPDSDGDDLLAVCAVLDTAAMSLSELPAQVRRDVLHAVTRLLDDGEKRGPVQPLTSGAGH